MNFCIIKDLLLSKKRVLEDLSLLVLRLFMGSTFIIYGTTKVMKFDNYVTLFADKLALPFPILNLYVVILCQVLGGIMLILGVLNRVVAIPLIGIMFVAMLTVNINNGFFAAPKFGVEVNLAYISILFIIFAFGAGRYSVDNKILKDESDSCKSK